MQSSTRRRTARALCVLCLVLLPGSSAASGPVVLSRTGFGGPDGTLVSSEAFYDGEADDAQWFAEDGELRRVDGTGRTSSSSFRMWTRRADLTDVTAELDVVLHGWDGGDEGWHGVNLWLNRSLCVPRPGCGRVDDGADSGYVLDFVNRDGSLTILKKLPGHTREQWPDGHFAQTKDGTYYQLAGRRWSPELGRRYRFSGSVRDDGDGSSTLQVRVDGELLLQVVDDGSVGGPRLDGGRVGLRSDYADITVDDLVVRR